MKFLIAQTRRKKHISELEDCADYCITAEETVIMRCPVDGTLAYLPKANLIISTDPLTVWGPFKFPCPSGAFHAFTVRDGKLQSSVYSDKRYPIKGFDEKYLWR